MDSDHIIWATPQGFSEHGMLLPLVQVMREREGGREGTRDKDSDTHKNKETLTKREPKPITTVFSNGYNKK